MYEIFNYKNNHKKTNLTKLWKEISDFKLDLELKRQILHDRIIYKICNNNVILSPIKEINLILNLGAGYGSWSHIFSILNKPYCVINIDIENYYPNFYNYYINNRAAEPVIEFEKTDLKIENIKRESDVADFIYQRDMLSVYTLLEWEKIIKEIFRVLKRKCYAEFVEYDFIIKHDNLINNKFSNKINNYLINKFKKNDYIYDINIIIEIIKKIFNNKIYVKDIKLFLYENDIFDDDCIDVLTVGYEYFKNEIETLFNMNFEDFIKNIKKEWITNKSYITLYIIYIKK